jgi:hypothetical protein
VATLTEKSFTTRGRASAGGRISISVKAMLGNSLLKPIQGRSFERPYA